jgi:hypothetical protein
MLPFSFIILFPPTHDNHETSLKVNITYPRSKPIIYQLDILFKVSINSLKLCRLVYKKLFFPDRKVHDFDTHSR